MSISLPNEIIYHIFAHSEARDLVNFLTCSKEQLTEYGELIDEFRFKMYCSALDGEDGGQLLRALREKDISKIEVGEFGSLAIADSPNPQTIEEGQRKWDCKIEAWKKLIVKPLPKRWPLQEMKRRFQRLILLQKEYNLFNCLFSSASEHLSYMNWSKLAEQTGDFLYGRTWIEWEEERVPIEIRASIAVESREDFAGTCRFTGLTRFSILSLSNGYLKGELGYINIKQDITNKKSTELFLQYIDDDNALLERLLVQIADEIANREGQKILLPDRSLKRQKMIPLHDDPLLIGLGPVLPKFFYDKV